MNAPSLNRTTFVTSRLLDFASKKELIAQTGHDVGDWPLVVLKELVDNALDACENAGVAPVININVDETGITITDNGPGLPASTIEGVLDFAVRVSSNEAYVSPSRGAQGNALKTVVCMPFALSGGESGRVDIEAHGVCHSIELAVDRIRQAPVIGLTRTPSPVKTGTVVKVRCPSSPWSIREAEGRFLQIADDFGWLNPHLSITVDWFGEQRQALRATDTAWLKWRPSDPTSAHWYTADRFERLIGAYLVHDDALQQDRPVREFVAEFRGLSGSAKQKIVLAATGLARAPLSQLVHDGDIDHEKAAVLLAAMKANSKQVKPAALGLIGKAHFEACMVEYGCEMESFTYNRVMEDDDGVPVVYETAFGWCPNAKRRRWVAGVNWSPGLINPFRQLGRGESLDTILGNQRANRDEPVILVLHVACPRVEYLDRGKSAVSTS